MEVIKGYGVNLISCYDLVKTILLIFSGEIGVTGLPLETRLVMWGPGEVGLKVNWSDESQIQERLVVFYDDGFGRNNGRSGVWDTNEGQWWHVLSLRSIN